MRRKVKLLTCIADAEKLICAAAILYYASDPATLFSNKDGEVTKFIARLRDMGHLSPFEHASFTFLLEGISRALTHQLVRHRIASYSQRSQRYVSHDTFEYILPPSLKGTTVETGEGEVDAAVYYDEMLELAHEAAPVIFEGIGPKCVQFGYCPEGKMTCGKIKEMKKKYEM